MESDEQDMAPQRRRSDRRHRAGIVLAIAWTVLVTIVLWLQTAAYAGLPALVAEWEFDHFGGSYPMVNYVVLVALFSLPALLLLPGRRAAAGDGAPRRGAVRLVANGRGVLRLLIGLIAGVVVALLVLTVRIATLPTAYGQPQRIVVSAAGGGTVPEGPAVLVGRLRADRTALFDQNLLLVRRHYRFVPMEPASAADSTLRFFVARDDASDAPPASGEPVGILRRASLPGEVARLYRDAGYVVAPVHYVLYPNRSAMYWPLLATLAPLGLALLVLAVAAFLIQRQLRRTRDAVLESLTAGEPLFVTRP